MGCADLTVTTDDGVAIHPLNCGEISAERY